MHIESQLEIQRFAPLDPYNPDIHTPTIGEFFELDLNSKINPNVTEIYNDGTEYNSSIPFYDMYKGDMRRLIMSRYESLYAENNSKVIICDFDTKEFIPDAPVFLLSQDPYYLGEFRDAESEPWKVIGMVRIELDKDGKIINWYDALYRYKDSIMELGNGEDVQEPWLVGPSKSKDLRFAQQENGIIVTPRPQGSEFGGLGSVGIFETLNLDTLERDLGRFYGQKDPDSLIKGLFADGHWGGINQIIGRIGGTNLIRALGHDAFRCMDALKHYESTAFIFDSQTLEVVGDKKTIAKATDFAKIEPKPGHDLGNVVFTAGVVACNDGTRDRWLFKGVADRKIGRIRVKYGHQNNNLLQIAA